MLKLPGPMPLSQRPRHDLAGHGRRAVIARLNAFLLAQVNVAQQIPGLSCAYLGQMAAACRREARHASGKKHERLYQLIMICNNRQILSPSPSTVAPLTFSLTGPAPMNLKSFAMPASSLVRALLAAITLSCLGLSAPSFADTSATAQSASVASSPATGSPVATASEGLAPATGAQTASPGTEAAAEATAADGTALEETLLSHDMSPWGMFQNADVIVRGVMIGLALASVLTWTIWLSKGIELFNAKRRLQAELRSLQQARSLSEAQRNQQGGLSQRLIEDAQHELELSAQARGNDGIKERVSFRLERLVAASGREMSKGTGVLATIGSTAPFVGLFGTVWGIMNSFIDIAKSQTTNLAVVAPGIAEALLATALGLVAAIPAVVIYNVFARSITGYKAQVADASAQVLLLVSRDLDLPGNERVAPAKNPPHMVKVG